MNIPFEDIQHQHRRGRNMGGPSSGGDTFFATGDKAFAGANGGEAEPVRVTQKRLSAGRISDSSVLQESQELGRKRLVLSAGHGDTSIRAPAAASTASSAFLSFLGDFYPYFAALPNPPATPLAPPSIMIQKVSFLPSIHPFFLSLN